MMRRVVGLGIVFCICVAAISFLSAAQPESVGFAISDLQLISTASRLDWTERWTAPVEGATIMAWFHEHGYPDLLTDLNGDGVIDELDTIELGDRFGKTDMQTATERGTTDALLVYGLAKYVAARYPGQFELKIYDAGFPVEFERDILIPFSPDAIPGIILTLKPEPNYAAYQSELQSGQGVIVGAEEAIDRNDYLAGRSFLFRKTQAGWYSVDLAWAQDDRWQPGIQGQILQTEAMETDALYLYYQGVWTKVECMLGLSPTIRHKPGPSGPCPQGSIGYDVSTATTPYGDVRIEECVTREGKVDTYTYTVTNISFVHNGCGLCLFGVPNSMGLLTLAQDGPASWLVNPTWPDGWQWMAPLFDCGILAGESAVFSFSVLAPTTDVAVTGYVGECAGPGLIEALGLMLETFRVQTTGPGKGDIPRPDCPDLTVTIDRSSCSCQWMGNFYQCTITVHALVRNIGAAPAGFFHVGLSTALGDADQPIPSLAAGASTSVTLTVTSTCTRGHCPCPGDLSVTADSWGQVVECDEKNNTDTGTACCK